MKLNTASAIISFAEKIENESAQFYERLLKRFNKDENVLSSFVKENRKNVVQIKRAYYGVITDAIESCFAFNIEAENYAINTSWVENISYFDALNKALELEEKIKKFYENAAEQSKTLMADIPRQFMMVAQKRSNRISKIKALKNSKSEE